MKPTWSRQEGALHLNYELPFRVHTQQIYPILAPNGSSIIVVGHERGLTVLWRGGRPYRHALGTANAQNHAPKATQRASQDAIMVIDSDEDDATNEVEVPTEDLDFDSEEDEYDPSEPYDKIIDTLEISSPGTAVLHLAVPPIPPDADKRAGASLPPLLAENIVVAAVCADSSVRLFAIPLAPSPASPERPQRNSQEQRVHEITISEAQSSPRHLPRGVSLTWTSKHVPASGLDLDDGSEGQLEAEPRRTRSQASSRARNDTTQWTMLVALHTAQSGGVLAVYQCSLPSGTSQLSKRTPSLLQMEYLRNPATNISFSSSHYPSKRHTQLLVTDSTGAVRIYDPSPRPRLHSGRSTRDPNQDSARPQGVWLASLFPPFEESKSFSTLSTAGPQRTRVLDAQWALDGRCIVVLLADEQWGVWDMEGIAPAGMRSLTPGGADGVGMDSSAGSLTRFALRGFVGDSADARSEKLLFNDGTNSTMSSARGSGRLAPMTPNTRKAKQQRLFTGPAQLPSSIPGLVRGGLSLSAASSTTSGNISDECLVLWFGSSVFAIPSLMTYWQRVAGSSGKSQDTGALLGPSITQITGISTGGEMVTGISQLPQLSGSQQLSSRPTFSQSIQHDLLISTEHSLVMLCPTNGRERYATVAMNLHQTEEDNSEDGDAERLDEDLLRRQELDLHGLNRFLDGMTNGSSTRNHTLGNAARNHTLGNAARGRRVGFAAGY